MQVLLFAGSNYYPKAHFGDLMGILPAAASTESVAVWVKQFMESPARFDLPTCSIEWVATLTTSTGLQAVERRTWKCLRRLRADCLRDEGYTHLWQIEDDEWMGLKEVPSHEDLPDWNPNPLATWPAASAV